MIFLYPCQRMSYHSGYSMSMKTEPVTSTEKLICDFGFALSIIFRGVSASMHSLSLILRAVLVDLGVLATDSKKSGEVDGWRRRE